MLDHTRAALEKIKRDITVFSRVYTVVLQTVVLIYFTVALLLPKGYFAVNIVGVSVTLFYLVFYLVTIRSGGRAAAGRRRRVKRIVKLIKLSLSAFTLATIAYSVFIASSDGEGVTPFTVVTLPILLIVWVLQIIIEVLKYYISAKLDLFVDGIRLDVESVSAPISEIKNRVHRFFDEKTAPPAQIDDKSRDILTERVRDKKEQRRERRLERRASRMRVLRKMLFGDEE